MVLAARCHSLGVFLWRSHTGPQRKVAVGQTILVVDDDPNLVVILTTLLEDAGYAVRQASDGRAALEAIAAHPPDLVLSDVRMPRLDGRELVDRLARQAIPIPVILMSSAHVALDGHAVPFLAKPFDFDRLLTLEREVLAQ